MDNRECPRCNKLFSLSALRQWLQEHATCPNCRAPLRLAECSHNAFAQRHANTLPTDCSRGAKYQRGAREEHAAVCMSVVVSCTYAALPAGCRWQGVRGALPNHQKQCPYDKVAETLHALQAEVRQLKEQVASRIATRSRSASRTL